MAWHRSAPSRRGAARRTRRGVCYACLGLLLWLPLAPRLAQARCALPGGYEVPRPGAVSTANRRAVSPVVDRAAQQQRLEPALVHAVIAAESGYNPVAVSEDGAIGLMQVLPATAADYRDADLCDPVVNVEVGTGHLARLLRKYRNISHALAAYNAGEGTMSSQRRRVTYVETRKFVVRAIAYYWQNKGVSQSLPAPRAP